MPLITTHSSQVFHNLRAAWLLRKARAAAGWLRAAKLRSGTRPLVAWGAVLAVALFSFYVHVLDERMQRVGSAPLYDARQGLAPAAE